MPNANKFIKHITNTVRPRNIDLIASINKDYFTWLKISQDTLCYKEGKRKKNLAIAPSASKESAIIPSYLEKKNENRINHFCQEIEM